MVMMIGDGPVMVDDDGGDENNDHHQFFNLDGSIFDAVVQQPDLEASFRG